MDKGLDVAWRERVNRGSLVRLVSLPYFVDSECRIFQCLYEAEPQRCWHVSGFGHTDSQREMCQRLIAAEW